MATEDIFETKKNQGIIGQNINNNADQVSSEAPATQTTQSNQDWAKGDLKVTDQGVYFTPSKTASAAAPAPNPNETVEGRLSGILNSNSDYIKASEAAAQRQANSRGLLNSTMAATAGRKAAIESALPIASQDAGYFQQKGLQQQQGDIQKGLYETQGDITSKLQSEKFDQDMALKQADIEWNKLDLEARMQVEYDRLDQQNKDRFDATTSDISESYMRDFLEILANPNFATPADKQAALNVLNEITKQRYAVAGQIAGVELDWSGVPEIGGAAPKIPAPASTPAPPAWYTKEPEWSKVLSQKYEIQGT